MKSERQVRQAAEGRPRRGLRFALHVVAALSALAPLTPAPALAQGWNWPWEQAPQPAPKPVPREPAWVPPDPPRSPPPIAQPGPAGGGWSGRNNICLELEQRLVQEGQKGNSSRDLLPMLETQIRAAEQHLRNSQQQLDRGDCYEFFLFSKTLRRTKKCVEFSREVENAKRQLADLDAQRQQIAGSAGRSYQDEIIRELARNNCGAGYSQEASRREGQGPFSSIWQGEDTGVVNGGIGQYGNLGYATYRTLCVRHCDGYYFPISFSTLPNHFERDAEVCQSKCAAPASLYFHQNPGEGVEQAMSFGANEPYTNLKSAFRYRKEYVNGCSCKQAEFVPEGEGTAGAAPEQKSDAGAPITTGSTERHSDGTAASGWSTETAPQQ